MARQAKPVLPQSGAVLGGTVLGGAAGGFSYEGATRDAQAREEAVLKREAGQLRDLPKRKAATPKVRA